MKKAVINYLDFDVNKLTRSIENAVSGDSFQTDISNYLKADTKQTSKKNGWLFEKKKS